MFSYSVIALKYPISFAGVRGSSQFLLYKILATTPYYIKSNVNTMVVNFHCYEQPFFNSLSSVWHLVESLLPVQNEYFISAYCKQIRIGTFYTCLMQA